MRKNIQIFIIILLLFFNILLEKYNYDSFVSEYIINTDNTSYLFNKLNDFIIDCRNETLFIKYNYSYLNPKISVIIPSYNSNLTIKSTISSIQKQKMNEIEIILIDDFSSDNSLEIIENMSKEDKRIKLIKNMKQRGTLYTRSIGALNSKGKYIMSIDQDDFFINDIFNICYNESQFNNIDILEFSGLFLDKPLFNVNSTPIIPYFLRFKKNGIIVKKPELSNFNYIKENGNYKLIDTLIWGKCIKSKIYKLALKILGEEIYTENICWSEDRIVNSALFKVANSFKFINYYGIIHQRLNSSLGNNWINSKRDKIFSDEFLNILSLYKINNNRDNINMISKIASNQLNILVSIHKQINIKLKVNILKKLFNCKYISKKEKNKLFRIFFKLK